MLNSGFTHRVREESGRVAGPLLLFVGFTALAGLLAAGQLEEYQVKAAFLYNFAKFVAWAPESFKTATDPIVICILGANPFGNTLQQTVSGKTVDERAFVVRPLSDPQSACKCHLLFVNAAERRQFRSLLRSLRGAGVLTVGEDDAFTADGGVIDFKLQNGKIHLEVNLAAAEYENLRISSRLLSLAQIVRKDP